MGYISLKIDSCASVIIKSFFSNDFDAQTYLALRAFLLEDFIWCHLGSPYPSDIISLAFIWLWHILSKKILKALKTFFFII